MTNRILWNIHLPNVQDRLPLLDMLMSKKYTSDFEWLKSEQVEIVSQKTILKFIDEELIHDKSDFVQSHGQTLYAMSSGERKKAYLDYVLSQSPSLIILDHFFDNIDQVSRQGYIALLQTKIQSLSIINIYTRQNDTLAFLPTNYLYTYQGSLETSNITSFTNPSSEFVSSNLPLPAPLHPQETIGDLLVNFDKVNVSYLDRRILSDITWQVEKGQFWHLHGPNGSGKTTLLTMIIGDNPKAYGQNITLFGQQKGSGESIWDIKQKVGYFTTNLTFQFKRQQTLREMIISGFFDSIGLYQIAGDQQVKLANEWLAYIGLMRDAKRYFTKVSLCHQRMVMIARAMVKHPPLLILDEPSVDLDEKSARMMTELINRIAASGKTTIIYVSHRIENGLSPTHSFELVAGENGSTGKTVTAR